MQGGDTMALLNSLWPFVLMGGIFYFMLWKPQKKEQQKRQDLLNSLKEGDEIITIGGIYGKITAISGATGAKYSLVPTDNSAGNFVKIQQRIPVRIDFINLSEEDNDRLAAGMMVVVKAKL